MGARAVHASRPYLLALAGVGAMTVVISGLRAVTPVGRTSVVYLVVVLLAATRLGRGAALLASVAAFLAYDYFFTAPYHELTISDPDEWISLSLFLITAVITGQVAANERARAQDARRREREAILLFDVIRLLTHPDAHTALRELAARIRAEYRVDAVRIDLVLAGDRLVATAGIDDALRVIGDPSPTDLLAERSSPGAERHWVHVIPPRRSRGYALLGTWRRSAVPVRSGDKEVGRVTLVRGRDQPGAIDERSLGFIADQLALLSERAELENAVTEAEVLRRASELKTALLNAVSHELRTPLASILASAGSLLQRDVRWTADDRDAFAADIEQQARRLDRVVGDLLDLSRVESGALRPTKDLHEIGALIDDVVGRAMDRGTHRIVARIPEDLPPARVDRVAIEHVISNLIDNAMKYAPEGSSIEVSARAHNAELVVEVSDEGPGVPAAAIPFVFEPFYRARTGGVRPSGLGLGLAVAKGLVQAHGGRIWVRMREGGGAAFAFALPLTTGAPVAVPA